MWTRLIAKLLALIGLYALILAGVGMRFSGQTNSSSFNLSVVELAVVTVVFILIAAFMVTRRPRQPLE
jgi:hypothetical protein